MKQFMPVALQARHFRRFIIGYALSLTSRSMVPVVVTFALFEAGRGARAVAIALAAETVPLAIFLLIGGVVADKFPRRNVMACANILCFGSQAVLASLFLTHHTPLWAIAALMACIGSGTAFFKPSVSGLIRELVPQPHLQSANGVSSLVKSVAMVAGPALGGLLVGVAGGGVAIATAPLTSSALPCC